MKENLLYLPPFLSIFALLKNFFDQILINNQNFKEISFKAFIIIALLSILVMAPLSVDTVLIIEGIFIIYFLNVRSKLFENFSIYILIYYLNVFLVQNNIGIYSILISVLSINLIGLINDNKTGFEKDVDNFKTDSLINLIFNLLFLERLLLIKSGLELKDIIIILLVFIVVSLLKRFLIIDKIKKVSLSLLILIIGALI